ncbi:Lactoylglutathione lyase [Minicystis rosea]|nr:Lactoylglutathione lyase [Minicystis rosea]
MSILDHITLHVSDYARSKAFYEQALAPLGIVVVMDFGKFCGFGRDGKPDFWIGEKPGEKPTPVSPTHVAFSAGSRADVEAFHKAALAAGGKDNGAPGIREQYHPNYYGAFVIDPDGHNIESVIHH